MAFYFRILVVTLVTVRLVHSISPGFWATDRELAGGERLLVNTGALVCRYLQTDLGDWTIGSKLIFAPF